MATKKTKSTPSVGRAVGDLNYSLPATPKQAPATGYTPDPSRDYFNYDPATQTATPDPNYVSSLQSAGPDIASLMAQLTGGPSPNFTGDANSAIAGAYKPVLTELEAQKKAALNRGATNDKQIQGMYAGLASSIGQENNAIGTRVAHEGQDLRNTYAGTASNIDANTTAATDRLQQLLQNAGVQSAAPDVYSKVVGNAAFAKNLSGVSGQNAQQLAAQLGTNAQQFNSTQKNLAGFAGNDARQVNNRAVEDRLTNIGSTRANTLSQQGQSAAQLAQQMSAQYLSMQQNQANALMSAYQHKADQAFEMQKMQYQGQLDAQKNAALNAANIASKSVGDQYKMWQMTPNGDKVFSTANQVFGGDAQAANKAMALLQQVDANSPNAIDFARKLIEKNRETNSGLNESALQNLAMSAYGINRAQYNPYAPSSE
jgi:hypothetical protein